MYADALPTLGQAAGVIASAHMQLIKHTNTISHLSAALNGNRSYIKELSRDFITCRAARKASSIASRLYCML